ncbi:MAG: cadherin-like domain-containing protein, partial [Clostridiales bacterium]|nr:cadherin-like domain-containing protein [Clostridiales bacterium]
MSAKFIRFRPTAMLLIVMLCLWLTIYSSAAQTPYGTSYCYEETEFSDAALDGIVVTGVPSSTVATVCYGSRVLRAGDILPASVLSKLTLEPVSTNGADAVLTYLPVVDGKLQQQSEITVTIGKKDNEPPQANDSELETYKNIANNGKLSVTDPENGKLTYTIITEPKRGTVEIQEDGTFVYTPKKNKVGTDRFTFVATDDAGNISNEAT